MTRIRSEDILIFNGLTPGITKMKLIYKALENFCKKKKSIDASDRFNIIFFQEDGPNYLESFTLNPEHILVALKSLESTLVRVNIGGGIFVAITFIIEVFKQISEKSFRLIVLTDAGSPKILPIFIPVLENLIDHVKDMPFFIDIVRIDIDDPDEDLKLTKLIRHCGGNIHSINNISDLNTIMKGLALKAEITSNSLLDSKGFTIPLENQPFYENLADNLIVLDESKTCSICFQKDDKDIVMCPSCGTIAHKNCWAQWALIYSIGIDWVFRCHNCYNLIKLDKNFMQMVNFSHSLPGKDIETKFFNAQKYLESLETKEGPKIIQAEDPMAMSAIISNNNKLPLNDKVSESEKVELDYDKIKFVLCPSCFKMITNEYKRCPNCHNPTNY